MAVEISLNHNHRNQKQFLNFYPLACIGYPVDYINWLDYGTILIWSLRVLSNEIYLNAVEGIPY